MNKELRRAAQRMLERARSLGLTTREGQPVVIDLMEELLAAGQGFRNAHAWRAALARREPPALVQENPDEAGSDFKLVRGRGCWISMGAFSVHPYLTDEGVVVDIYAKSAEDESLASTYAFDSDAEAAFCEHHGMDLNEALEWAQGSTGSALESASSSQRMKWLRRYVEHRRQHAAPTQCWSARQEVLEELGYEVSEDPDQPGLWQWSAPTDGCDASFDSQADAVRDAWRDASQQACAVEGLSTQQWDALSFEQQCQKLRALSGDA